MLERPRRYLSGCSFARRRAAPWRYSPWVYGLNLDPVAEQLVGAHGDRIVSRIM
jgi:hypothetical protein